MSHSERAKNNHLPLMTHHWKVPRIDDFYLPFQQGVLGQLVPHITFSVEWRHQEPRRCPLSPGALKPALKLWRELPVGVQEQLPSPIPESARCPPVPPRCGSLSIIKVGSARASRPGSFINRITRKINVPSLSAAMDCCHLLRSLALACTPLQLGSAQ